MQPNHKPKIRTVPPNSLTLLELTDASKVSNLNLNVLLLTPKVVQEEVNNNSLEMMCTHRVNHESTEMHCNLTTDFWHAI